MGKIAPQIELGVRKDFGGLGASKRDPHLWNQILNILDWFKGEAGSQKLQLVFPALQGLQKLTGIHLRWV